jgi:hypothetical protein
MYLIITGEISLTRRTSGNFMKVDNYSSCIGEEAFLDKNFSARLETATVESKHAQLA